MSWLQQLCEIGWQNISYIYFIVLLWKFQIQVKLKLNLKYQIKYLEWIY